MDAARYRKIQDLFWEAEEIDPSQWRKFLARRAGEDAELVDEVISLLREHDPEAALTEGNEVKAVVLPATVRGDAQTQVSSSGIPQQDKPKRHSNVTIASSNRTHASPRTSNPISPSPNRRSESTKEQTTLTTQTGAISSSRSWIPVWITLWIAVTTSMWVASWLVGRGEIRTDWELGRRVLPMTMQQAKSQIELRLARDRERTRTVTTGRGRRILEMVALADTITSANEDIKEVESSLLFIDDPRFELAIWSSELRCIIASKGLQPNGNASDLDASLTAPLASMIRTCLKGENVFCGYECGRMLSSHVGRVGMGWMVPVYRNHPSTEAKQVDAPIGVVMLLRYGLSKRLQVLMNHLGHTGGVDAYLVDSQGVMQTESRLARSFLGLPSIPHSELENGSESDPILGTPEPNAEPSIIRIAGKFRVAEYDGIPPQLENNSSETERIPPLTIAAATLARSSTTEEKQSRILPGLWSPEDAEPYPNYTGAPNQGVWKWFSDYDFGLIIERPSKYPPEVFDLKRLTAWTTPLSITWPIASLLSLLALPIVSALTWLHHQRIRASESKNRPLARYSIQDELGVGGMGVVYRAEHKDLGRDVAIKLLRSDCQAEDDRHRFDREARLAATLSCPHSVTVFDYGYTTDGAAFCVMELLEGITLAEVVARSGPQPPGRVVWVMQQICQSILEAHSKGLMHRDLKPQNVMLRLDPIVGDWAVVFDFGLAKPIEPSRDMFQTADTIWAGTPMYMAPERFREPSVMDPRSDIYSIGCIAYYLLAGNPPFAECAPESMFGLIMTELPIEIATHRGEDINEELDQWIRTCMAKDKRSRASEIDVLNRKLQSIADRMPWSRSDAEAWWAEHSDHS